MIFGNGTDPAEFNKLTGTSAPAQQVNPLLQNAQPVGSAPVANPTNPGINPGLIPAYQITGQTPANYLGNSTQSLGAANQSFGTANQSFTPWTEAFPWLNSYPQHPGDVSGMWSS